METFRVRYIFLIYKLGVHPVTINIALVRLKSQIVFSDSTSAALFELSGRLFLAVSSSHFPFASGHSQIFAKKDGNWELTQRIPTSGSFVKHFEYQNYHYLAFANSAPMYETKEPKSIQVRFPKKITKNFQIYFLELSTLIVGVNFLL